MTARPQTRDEAARELLRTAALRMKERVGELSEQVTARLHTEVPGFVDHAGDPDCSLGGFATMITMHLDRLVDPERDADAARYMREAGRRQAAQGMPPELLAHVFAVGGAVVWQGLVDTVAAHHPGGIPLMVHIAPRMWGFRERTAAILADVYQEGLGDATADGGGSRAARVLEALLDGRTDSLGVRAAAQALGVPGDGRFVVAVTSVRASASGTPGGDAFPVGAGSRVLRVPRGSGEVLVVLLGDRSPGTLAALLGAVPGLRAGVSPVVHGLAELHRALTLAELALPTCAFDGEVALWEDRMPTVVAAADRRLAGELAEHVLGPLRRLPDEERESLLLTFATWMECDGSPRAAAERMDCHRNTVLNRLRRLELLTGRRLAHPRDLVDLTLAVDVLRSAPAA
ncbi:PucR family transcriptional regulator [Actinacidiphila glaucinigra]|uniref:PucR family transcriptional regulator n=1 Tax=Actinacidiphila glaucinigra TaxID=235986 RepID=UPI002E371381|nr:helix-turn-helix domain-containing protein [Actinacidiphila glaucinigra]